MAVAHGVLCVSKAGYYDLGTVCTQGYFCPLDDSDNQFVCPAGTTTSTEGAAAIDQCVCPLGFVNTLRLYADCSPNCPDGHCMYYADWVKCTQCTQDRYCPFNASDSIACPLGTVAPPGSDNVQNCTCKPGSYRMSLQTVSTTHANDTQVETTAQFNVSESCALCPVNSYCSGWTHMQHCPAHTRAFSGSVSVTDCVSNAGYYTQGQPCPVGAYCPFDPENTDSETAIPCPDDSRPLGNFSVSITQCVCNAGLMTLLIENYPQPVRVQCAPCAAGYYCQGTHPNAVKCPVNTVSPVGSHNSSHCACAPGTNSVLGVCVPCPIGRYCRGDSGANGTNSSVACPTNTDTFATVARGLSDCRPVSTGILHNGTICPPGYYCSHTGIYECPNGSVSTQGAHSRQDCICTQGLTQGLTPGGLTHTGLTPTPATTETWTMNTREKDVLTMTWASSNLYVYLVYATSQSCIHKIDLRTQLESVFAGDCMYPRCSTASTCHITGLYTNPFTPVVHLEVWVASRSDNAIQHITVDTRTRTPYIQPVHLREATGNLVVCPHMTNLHWTSVTTGWLGCVNDTAPATVTLWDISIPAEPALFIVTLVVTRTVPQSSSTVPIHASLGHCTRACSYEPIVHQRALDSMREFRQC